MSCLFDSLSRFLLISSYQLRQNICNYLQNNPILFDGIKASDWIFWENNTNLSNYINNMRNPNTWGGGIEIKSFCNIYKVQVNIHFRNRVISFFPNNSYDKIININYSGNHFTPIS